MYRLPYVVLIHWPARQRGQSRRDAHHHGGGGGYGTDHLHDVRENRQCPERPRAPGLPTPDAGRDSPILSAASGRDCLALTRSRDVGRSSHLLRDPKNAE